MLVDRGLLTPDELDEVLALQKESGRKLGEIIVERGFISGPTLALTLAEQWGVELTADEGFGTGLRNEIQRRHEGERKRRPALHAVDEPPLKGHEIFAPDSDEALAEVSALLAEDDARIVHLEAGLVERDHRIAKLEDEARDRETGIAELVGAELLRLEERFSETQKELLAAAADWRAKHEAQIVKLLADKLGRLEAGIHETRGAVLPDDERARLETRVVELVSQQLNKAQRDFLAAAAGQRSSDEARFTRLLKETLGRFEGAMKQVGAPVLAEEDKRGLEERIVRRVAQELIEARKDIAASANKQRSQDEARLTRLLGEKLARIEAGLKEGAAPALTEEDKHALERRLGQLTQELTELLENKLAAFEPAPAQDFSAAEARITKAVARELGRVEKALMGNAAQTEGKLAGANDELAAKVDELKGSLEALAKRMRRDRSEELGADLRTTVKRLDRLEELVHTSTREIVELFEQCVSQREPEVANDTEPQDGEEAPQFSEHLLFAPAESGYAVLTIDLPPPNVGAEVSLGNGERYVVTKVADSPFPRDARPCAYVQPLAPVT
jgi:hypothetical protein